MVAVCQISGAATVAADLDAVGLLAGVVRGRRRLHALVPGALAVHARRLLDLAVAGVERLRVVCEGERSDTDRAGAPPGSLKSQPCLSKSVIVDIS